MIDHRELLKKYMDLVADAEGTTFVPYQPRKPLTQDEWEELVRIENELIPQAWATLPVGRSVPRDPSTEVHYVRDPDHPDRLPTIYPA